MRNKREKLMKQFKKETGESWENSQGEPDIDYVLWLEDKIIEFCVVMRDEPCQNCKESFKECACMRNKCIKCNMPVGNVTFTFCDDCWDLHQDSNHTKL